MSTREPAGFASTEWDTDLEEIYSSTVSTAFTRHTSSIRDLTENILPTPSSTAKKRLKDFTTKHQTELLQFLGPDQDTVLQRTHRALSSKGTKAPAVDTLDVDLDGVYTKMNMELYGIAMKRAPSEGSAVAVYVEQTRWLVAQYKAVGEEVLRLETVLHERLASLDALQSRGSLLAELRDHDALIPLLSAFQMYAESMFADAKLEETYRMLMDRYKEWNVTRQLLISHQMLLSQEPKCSICIDRAVEYAVVPCGHTMCRECSLRIGTKCFLCRGNASQKIHLYFN